MARRRITGYIYTYSKKARETIVNIANKFLSKLDIPEISEDLFLCVDELVKNAVKANYKFYLIRKNLYYRLHNAYPERSHEEIMTEIEDIIKIQDSLDHIADEIITSENISTRVRDLLNQEAKMLDIKNKAHSDQRSLTEEEEKSIQSFGELNDIRKKIKKEGLKIILKIEADQQFIYIDVTNTAPILTKDLDRIFWIQEEFRKYSAEGREHEFFINNLDTSESGFGLGYATIDSILKGWGLDPKRAITIISSINTTILLTIPINVLSKT